jgi:hypothetical protein
MKIGILTLPLHTNYGGILQAYALKTALEKMGHEVYLIDTGFNKNSSWKAFKKFLKGILKKNTKLKAERKFNKIKTKSYFLFTKPFIDKHFPNVTKKFSDPISMGEKILEYNFEAYIVGSDQIWNSKYFKNIEISFFSFVKGDDKLKIAYAPSFGSEIWNYKPNKEKICKELIKKFDAVSVREISAVELCKKFFDIEAQWVLDPTMLLNPEEYVSILPDSMAKPKGNMFTYILDRNEDKDLIIEKISNTLSLNPYELETIDSKEPIPLEWGTKATVEEWIRNFHQAGFIVTDSYHGTVFSILFNKPFFSVINFKRGATRFKSLLNALDLSERLLNSFDDLTDSKMKKNIDWELVNKKLELERKNSQTFLYESLNEKNN